MSASKYSRVAIALHWLSALLIFALFGLGWFMVELPPGPQRGYYFALHKSIGLSVFLLLVLRVLWRLGHRPPPLPASIARWQVVLVRIVHLAFYLLLVLQPVSGYLSSSFSGYPTRLFGLPLPQWGWRDPPLNEFFTEVHVICSVTLLLLVATHLLGAMKHLLSGEGQLLRRMWPW